MQLSQDGWNGVCPVVPWQGVGGRLHHLALAAARCHFCTWGWMAGYDPDTVNSVPVLRFKERLRGRKTFLAAAAATGQRRDILRPCGSLSVLPHSFPQIYSIKLSVRYWSTYTVKTHLHRVLFLGILGLQGGSAEIMASTETDEKCHPSSAALLIWLPHIPALPSFCSLSSSKRAACGFFSSVCLFRTFLIRIYPIVF